MQKIACVCILVVAVSLTGCHFFAKVNPFHGKRDVKDPHPKVESVKQPSKKELEALEKETKKDPFPEYNSF